MGPDAGFFAVYRPHGRPWRPGERVRLPALAATLETLADEGFDAFYEGDLGERQARGLAAAGSPIDRADLRDHTSTWGEPIAIDYRGVRVTTHPPNSSGIVALELLVDPGPLRAAVAGGVRTGRRDRSGLDPHRHRGVQAGHGRPRPLPDRPGVPGRPGRARCPIRPTPPTLAALHRPAARRRARARPPTRSVAARSTSPRSTPTGNAVSLIESNYMGFGSGVVDPDTGIHYQNRGSYFSLDPDHPNVLEPGKRTLHTLLPGMLFRDGRSGPWVVAGSMGGDAQPQIHAQLVSALVDGGVDVRTAVAAPRWYVGRAGHFEPPVDVRLEPRHGRASPRRSRRSAIRSSRPRRSTAASATSTRSSSSTAVRAAPDGSVAAAPIRAAPGCPAVW